MILQKSNTKKRYTNPLFAFSINAGPVIGLTFEKSKFFKSIIVELISNCEPEVSIVSISIISPSFATIIGFDNYIEKFFWLSGQGGYGIQTSPALAEICSNLILNQSNDYFINNLNLNIDLMNINRFN